MFLGMRYILTWMPVLSFQVLGRCFLTVMQVHFQFLSQALQKVQPVAQSCLAEALAQAQERCTNARLQSSDLGPLTELEEASRSWKGAAEVCSHRLPMGSSRSGPWKCRGFSVWGEVRWLATHSWEMPAVYDFQLHFPISSFFGLQIVWTCINIFCTPPNPNASMGGRFVRGPN